MIYLILGVIIGSGLFIIPLWTYRRGLKDGIGISQGKPIEPIQNPLQMVAEHKEQKQAKKEDKAVSEGFANLMAYTGDEKVVPK